MEKHTRSWTRAWTLAMALVAALSLCMSHTVSAATVTATDPASVAVAFESAVGSDITAALDMLSDDATLKIVPAPQGTSGMWSGKQELGQALQYSKAHAVHRQIVGTPQVQGDNVTYMALVSNDVFQRLGVAPVQFSTQVVVQDSKIKSYLSVIVPAEQGRVLAALQAQQAGAATQQPVAQQPAAQQPAGMPRTGFGEMALMVIGLLTLSLLLVLAGFIVRGVRSAA